MMRIKEAREQAGLSQIELANRMGVSQGTVSLWESEVYLPKTRQLPVLAAALGCTINDLFGDIDFVNISLPDAAP